MGRANGRMYDPTLCQFVSPDPYIQDPTCWQNFNRYGYCLQNPMLYTDPDGEIVWVPVIIGAVLGGVVNWGIHGCEFNSSGLAAFGIGAAASAVGVATFGVGAASIGATFGVSSVPTAFMAGTISSFTSGMLLGTGNTILLGDPMMSPQSLIFSSLLGGTFCGLAQGLSNWIAGNKLWTGKPTWEDVAVDGIPIDESMVEPLELKSQPKPQQTPETAQPTSAVSGGEVKYTLIQQNWNAELHSVENLPKIKTTQIKGYDARLIKQTDIYHSFPRSLDTHIINNGYCHISENLDATYLHLGQLNGKSGVYTIIINNDGYIYHRCFYSSENFYKNFYFKY